MKYRYILCVFLLTSHVYGQTLFVPGSAGGIGSSSNGYVGVGVSAPATQLHINGALRINGAAGGPIGSGSRIEFATATNTFIEENWGLNLTGGDTQPVKIRNAALLVGYTSNSTGFGTNGNLLVQGNVGIGTTSPDAKLAVNGNISVFGFGSMSSNRNPINSYTNLFLGGGITDQANGTYKVITDGGSNYFAGIKMDNAGANAGAIKFLSGPSTGASSYTISNSDLDSYVKMIIVNGQVGIGTPSPDAKLAVKGQVHAQEVKIDLQGSVAPDYVFEKDYALTYAGANQNVYRCE